MVPSEFEDFPTDVVEFQNILIDDIRGDIEIGISPIIDPQGGSHMKSGTLGCVVRRRSDGRRYFLTCEHIVSHRSCDVMDEGACTGENLHDYQYITIYQPAQQSESFYIGQCVEASIKLDAAIINPTSSRGISNTIQEIGPLKGKGTVPDIWEPVWKRGKTTGLTNGLVKAVLVDQPSYPPSLYIVSFPFNTKFADHGDSGSAVVNSQQEVVALLYAVNDQSGTDAFATLIDPICDALQIDIAVGPVISSITPNSAMITSIGSVVIEGFGFESPNLVTFGGTPAAVLQETSNRLELIPPPMLISTVVDVRVENKWGESSEDGATSRFEYLPVY